MELNYEQKKAIEHVDGPCCVIAAAGAGKTTVLTERIKNLINIGVTPDNILVITFNKNASEEIKTRISNNKVVVSTFHGLCHKINNIENIDNYKTKEIINGVIQKKILQEVLMEMSWDIDYMSCLNFIACQKNMLRNHHDKVFSISDEFITDSLFKYKEMYRKYEEKKNENNIIDFEDILFHTFLMFKENINILKKYQKIYKYILVDEFQDTNEAQYQILKMIAVHNNIFVVGDINQAICSFRGSKLELFSNFKKKWANCKEFNLILNYRSTQNIIDFSEKMIKNNILINCKAESEKLFTHNEPIITGYENELDEVAGVIKTIKKLIEIDNESIENIAILYRFKEQSIYFSEKLQEVNIKFTKNVFESGLKLIPIHSSKGLEFNTVFIIGFNQGFIPYKNINDEIPNIEEDRRIAYMAINRAKVNLYISYVKYFHNKKMGKSIFLL